MLPGGKEELLNQEEQENKITEPSDDGSLDINIEEAVDEPKQVPQEKPDEEAAERKKNAEFAQRRLDAEKQELKLRNQKLEDELAQLRKPAEKSKAPEDWESELSKKPVSTIEAMIEKKANEIVERRLLAEKANTEFYRELEQSKQRVLKRHPELEDQGSEKAQIIFEVLQKNPQLTNKSDGPILAMMEMEEELERRGAGKKPENPGSKIPVGSMPQSRNIPSKKTVTLTKEQLDFCRENKVDPKVYAKSLNTFAGSTEMEV